MVQWRNWPLLVKLGVVLVVPVVGALVLGVLRVQADVSLADSYRETERAAALRAEFVSVVSALQHERNEAVRPGGRLQQAATATDRAVAAMSEVVRQNPEFGAATSGYRALDRAVDSLPAARRQVGGADGMVVLSAYTAVVNTVLEFDRSLVGRFPDENLANTSIALAELQGIGEQIALQQAVGSLALRDHWLTDAGRQMLVETGVRLDDKFENFRSQAPPTLAAHYEKTVSSQDVTEFHQMVDAVRTTGPAVLPVPQNEWDAASDATTRSMTELTSRAASDLRSDSAALAESVSDRAGLESVLLLTMVLLAAGIGGGLGRYLLRSLGALRRTALDVAHHRLPAAVESIRAGEGTPDIEPVPLRSKEEFGQLARAFDAVHGQAVRSAAEEAGLRSNLANIFTNLSRRSQGLVERQLRLMEQLEQKTDDPDQLENLFKIDHLATRMRRNNENLMVLSGTGLLRRFAEPMALPDVLRAAISEVEHYQRAIVRSVPDVRIAGYAAGDLIRSISELIENATAFSPPDAQVTVVSRLLQDGSAVVDILDHGVGMAAKELREANDRIAGGGGVDVPISRQMGLFVVGRLTARHGIHVRLIQRAEGGLCASVLVPAGLVNIGDPGATAAIEMPVPGQGPATATEWLGAAGTPVAATSWPATAVPALPHRSAPAEHPWLTTPAGQPAAAGTSGNRLAAALGKSTAGTSVEPWLTTPAGQPTSASTTGNRIAAALGKPTDQPWLITSAEPPADQSAAESLLAEQLSPSVDEQVVIEVPVVGITEARTDSAETFAPGDVAGRLETAGIIVSLPEFPAAATPASILFADSTSVATGVGEFSWLRNKSERPVVPPPAEPAEPTVTVGPAGLPKRVPRSKLATGPKIAQTPVPQPVTRNAARARGFMSGLQAGIRQSENRKGETGP
jgi:signal transduction histidine kinase